MSEFLSVLILGALALLLAVPVFLPAILELLLPKNDNCLPVDNLWSRRDMLFAERFRSLAAPWWSESPALGRSDVTLQEGHTENDAFLAARLECSAHGDFKQEVYVKERLALGRESHARAILSDGSATLDAACVVDRWLHGEKLVQLGPDCLVNARITSMEEVRLDRGCRTQLVSAPKITWSGAVAAVPVQIPTHAKRWLRRRLIPEEGRNWSTPRQSAQGNSLDDAPYKDTRFIDGDLILDHEADVDFPLVVRGNLYIRKGAVIVGDLKAHGDLLVEQSAVIGSLTCRGNLYIGHGSSVQGCLMSEKLLWLGDGVVIGGPENPKAVVGKQVMLTGNGVVHGRIQSLSSLVEVKR